MDAIIGTYECKVDAKGRVMLPSPLKKQLATSLQDGFVLKRSVFQPCLELYPEGVECDDAKGEWIESVCEKK